MTVAKVWASTAKWLFGLCVTILFLALWGRAVVVDTEELANSVAPLAESSQVVDLMAEWASEEFVEAGGDPALVDPTIDYVLESTAVGGSMERLIEEVVDAAASGHPGGSSVDMEALLTPLVPDIAFGLGQVGYPIEVDRLAEIVGGIDPLVIREPGTTAIVGPSSPTASRLGIAVLISSSAILLLGYSIIAVSDDKIAALRELLTRVAVGGLSFAVFLRVGSWVLDPSGGRAPISDTLSHIAASKWSVPLQVAVVAGTIALTIYLVRRRITPGAVSPEPDVSPKLQETRPLSPSGLR